MKQGIVWLAVVACLALSGCAGGSVPITEEVFDEAGDVVKVTTKYVADASVAKETVVHQTLQNRDRMIAKDAKDSGMKMEWETVEETIQMPGQAPIVMKRAMPKITYRERGQFNQKLPTQPSVHPGYATAERIVDKVVNGTIIGLGITEGADVVKAAIGSAGNKQTVNAETATLTDNRTDVSNTGAESHIDVSGTQPAQEPVIVEPTIVEVPAAAGETAVATPVTP